MSGEPPAAFSPHLAALAERPAKAAHRASIKNFSLWNFLLVERSCLFRALVIWERNY
jgi:hypothetical protein